MGVSDEDGRVQVVVTSKVDDWPTITLAPGVQVLRTDLGRDGSLHWLRLVVFTPGQPSRTATEQ